MEFGSREILILLGVLVIFAILLHGFRSVRQSQSGSIKLARRKQAIFDDEDINDLPPDLTTGEVRVKHRDEQALEQVSDNIKRFRERQEARKTSAFMARKGDDRDSPPAAAEHAAPPVHPEPLREEPEDPDHPHQPAPEPEPAAPEAPRALDDFAVDEAEEAAAVESGCEDDEDPGRVEPVFAVREDDEAVDDGRPFRVDAEDEGDHHQDSRRRPFWEDGQSRPPAETEKPRAGQDDAPGQTEVVIFHVMARNGGKFRGDALLEALLANHLRYGSMQIFHRHENRDGSGPVLFSLANSLNPGTFDLAAMEQFETPGVTLLMPLEGLAQPLNAYGELIKTAQNLSKALNATLQDETRSVLTKQTIEHYRQQIIEYTRRSFTLTN